MKNVHQKGKETISMPYRVRFPEQVEKYEDSGNCIHFIGKYFSLILKWVCLKLE